jgi:hypothetical protein
LKCCAVCRQGRWWTASWLRSTLTAGLICGGCYFGMAWPTRGGFDRRTNGVRCGIWFSICSIMASVAWCGSHCFAEGVPHRRFVPPSDTGPDATANPILPPRLTPVRLPRLFWRGQSRCVKAALAGVAGLENEQEG